MAAMTDNAIVIATPPSGATEWTISQYNADVSGGEDLKAGETGKYHYVKRLIIYAQSVTDVTFTIGAGQDTGITTVYLGPIPLSDTGSPFKIDFGPNRAMKIASATALSIDSSATCPVFVYAEGVTSAQ